MLKRELLLVYVFILTFLCCLCLVSASSNSVRINEVELNPTGEDNGNEWIELFSETQIEMNNWKIESSNGREMNFSVTFEGYYILVGSRNLLTNTNNSLKLVNDNGEEVDSTQVFADSSNNDKTWQYCSNEWLFLESSKNKDNNCPLIEEQKYIVEEEKIIVKENIVEEDIVQEETSNKKIEDNKKQPDVTPTINMQEQQIVEEETIILSSKDAKKENSIIYKSKKEYIREYAIYGFTLFCIFLIVLLLVERQRLITNKELE